MTYSFTTRPGQGARALIPTRYNLSGYTLSVEYDDNSNFNSLVTGYGTVTYANNRITLELSASDVDTLQDTFFRIKAVGDLNFYVTDGYINYVPLTSEEITSDLIDSNGYIKNSYLPPVNTAIFDENVSAVVEDTNSNTSTVLRAAFAAVSGRKASQLTQGLYARSAPTPSGETAGVLILAKDPNVAGRLWGFGLTSGKVGYTDDNLATFNAIQALPSGAAGLSPCQMEITHGVAGGDFMFVLFNSTSANQGGLWRAPAPGASPTSLTFTCIQANDATNNLANGPGAAATHTGDGSNYRNQCFAIQPDGSHAYLVNYAAGTASATPTTRTDGIMAAGSDILALPTTNAFYGSMHGMTITVSGAGAAGAALSATIMRIFGSGKVQLDKVAQTSVSGATVTFPAVSTAMDIFQGPYIRVCSNPCAADPATVSWSITKQWTLARHAHAVKIIGGVPWVNLGDFPYPNDGYGVPPATHVGMWAATDATGATWNQKMVATATTPYDGINFHPVTIGGQPMIVMESDSKGAVGPLTLPTQTNDTTIPWVYPSLRVQSPVVATMRCSIPTSEGNLMWYGTGESGAIGPVDGIFIAAAPYDTPILLEQLPAGTAGTPLNAVENGQYVYMGKLRITKEKFPGQ